VATEATLTPEGKTDKERASGPNSLRMKNEKLKMICSSFVAMTGELLFRYIRVQRKALCKDNNIFSLFPNPQSSIP